MTLAKPFPSSPSRPPLHVLKFTRRSDFRGSFGFTALYSAKKFLDLVIGEEETKWESTQCLLCPDSGMRIESDTLEEIVEHKYTPDEKKWEMPEPYLSEANCLRTGERMKIKRPEHFEQPVATKELPAKKPRNEGAKQVPRAARKEGMVSIGEICAGIKMEPRDARAILRKTDTPKPPEGWAWDKKGAASIAALLKKEAKK